jgi:hypothetical protein
MLADFLESIEARHIGKADIEKNGVRVPIDHHLDSLSRC